MNQAIAAWRFPLKFNVTTKTGKTVRILGVNGNDIMCRYLGSYDTLIVNVNDLTIIHK